ncbi:hypothetical protein MIMGU_mgv1a015277mg [Erythranthe guttata]|uniref:HR-like lesion-inducer n=1 Tax=Erythranthe guttata TaxID=4155 RepID=A0A022QXC5_ERYGU|nr:hypothetical protein MIMGU_mgv1a015277mg [Erythranthe guttata]
MAFLSFLGRLLFVSVFILSAYQEFNEFGVDGGPAAKLLKPKINVLSKHVAAQTGFQVPHVEKLLFQMKQLILGAIIMKALGSLLFVFGSSFGASILLLHQAISAPILYDFYNYEADKKEFAQLFVKFTQSLALLGALLFFIGMKNSMPRRSLKKKTPKAKTN